MRSNKVFQQMLDDIMTVFIPFALNHFAFNLREDQILLARTFFELLFKRKRHTLNVSICRQVGKTEVLVMCILFVLIYFEIIEKERIRICICAPEQGTSTEFFDRLKVAIAKIKQDGFAYNLEQNNNDTIVDLRGNRVDKFGLFKNYARIENKKSTREGRTFHLVVRDEKHMGDDAIFNDEIVPAMSTTGGLDIFIGNGGFSNCKAKQMSDMFTDKSKIVQTIGSITNFEINFNQMREIMIAEYNKTDNEMFMRWIDSQEAFIVEHGLESELVQKNLFNKWFTEVSNFIDLVRLQKLARENDEGLYSNTIHLGLDLAKSQDDTVLTLTDIQSNVRDWVEFKGEYTDQVRDIAQFIMSTSNIYNYEYMFVDTTGVGDPVRAMLKEAIGHLVIVRGIVFGEESKDILAKKALKAFSESDPNKRFSYPKNHKYTAKFEKQMIGLRKSFRKDGKMNYKHQDIKGAHDDYPDSTFLSLFKMQSISQTNTYATNSVDYS